MGLFGIEQGGRTAFAGPSRRSGLGSMNTRAARRAGRRGPALWWLVAAFLLVAPRPSFADEDGLWYDIRALLGGVEVSWMSGEAEVSAQAETGSGERLTVAGGDAAQRGFAIQLYGPPKRSGVIIAPALGYLSQRILLADFERRVAQPPPPFGQPLDAECSFPESGRSAPCTTVNSYALALESLRAGVRLGYEWLIPYTWGALIGSTSAVGHAVEYRSMEVDLGSEGPGTAAGWTGFKSVEMGAAFGVYWPRWHLAVRAQVSVGYYGSFEFSTQPEFMGRTICAGDFNRCTRERAKVSETTLSNSGLSLGLVWVL